MHLPEQYGGGGLGLYELAGVVEEASKAGVPLLTALYSPGVIGAIIPWNALAVPAKGAPLR